MASLRARRDELRSYFVSSFMSKERGVRNEVDEALPLKEEGAGGGGGFATLGESLEAA